MKVLYRQIASDDIVRQFRYYLLSADVPPVAIRFRESIQRTIDLLCRYPLIGPRYISDNPRLRNLRSWPIAGFESVRIYYSLEADILYVVRVLHSKRDVRNALRDA